MTFLARFSWPSRTTIRASAKIVAVVLLLELAALTAWWYFSQSRVGRLELTSDGPVLTVEVLDESGEIKIGEPIDVVKQATLTLPDGEYRLRVNGEGRLGRTYRATVNRGETVEHALSLDEGRLLGGEPDLSHPVGPDPSPEQPMPFAMLTRAIEFTAGKADIVEYTGQTVIRRDSVTGNVVWDAAGARSSYARERDPGPWLRGTETNPDGVSLVEPAVDLDGDATRDVTLVQDSAIEFVALSGKDGSLIWSHGGERPGTGGPRPAVPELVGPIQPGTPRGSVIGQTWIDDIDGDGAPELAVTIVFQESPAEAAKRTGKPVSPQTPVHSQRFVQAISGQTGRRLWSFPIDPALTLITARFWGKPATLIQVRSSPTLAILDGSRWLTIDPSTGRPNGEPIELGFEPLRQLQYADLDGDNEPEIVALGPGPAAKQQSLAAFSTASGKPLWTATVAAEFSSRIMAGFPELPWLVDLDSDGRSEIVVPDSGPLPPAGGYRGVQVIDGVSGRARWVRQMCPDTKLGIDLDHVLEAPDLDGDGVRELLAVSKFEGRVVPATNSEARPEPARLRRCALRPGRPSGMVVARRSDGSKACLYLDIHVVGTRTGWPANAGRLARWQGSLAGPFFQLPPRHPPCPGDLDGTRAASRDGDGPDRRRRFGRRRSPGPVGRRRRPASRLSRSLARKLAGSRLVLAGLATVRDARLDQQSIARRP
jgi:hypothetical protein